MLKAFAPRQCGGSSWVLLAVVLVGALPVVAPSQETKKEKPATPGASAPADGKQAEAGGAAAAGNPESPTAQVEIFRDPRTAKFLDNNFPVLGKQAPSFVVRQIKGMAAGQVAVDRKTIERFVESAINDLTDRTNIRAVIDPAAPTPPGAQAQYAIQRATDDLIEPILVARGQNNGGFLSVYNAVLLQALPPLLDGHLLSRIAAAIVLSQTAVPEAVDVFIKQLNNREQTVWVKLWMARGLTNIQQVTRFNLDTARAIRAAKAVADFLEAEKDLPWPVQYRALEALGSLRLANTPQMQKGQPEMAGTATQFLTDPEKRLEVRAEAGWALGMMQVPAGISGYNFPMLAYSVGDVAATLGERIREIYPKNPGQAESWAGLLVAQILQAFDGVDGARESGLLKTSHPGANQARQFIKQVSDKARPLTASAVKLVKDPVGRSAQNLKDLEAKIADLRGWLQKNPPPNAWLVPNGPKFPVGGAQVANAPGGAARVVNAPAGPVQ